MARRTRLGGLSRSSWRSEFRLGALKVTWRAVYRSPRRVQCAMSDFSAPRGQVRCAPSGGSRECWEVSRRVGGTVPQGVSCLVAAASDFPLQIVLDAAPIGAASSTTGSNETDKQQRDAGSAGVRTDGSASSTSGSNRTDGQQGADRQSHGPTGRRVRSPYGMLASPLVSARPVLAGRTGRLGALGFVLAR